MTAIDTEKLSVTTDNPHPYGSQIQTQYRALSPDESFGKLFAATMTIG